MQTKAAAGAGGSGASRSSLLLSVRGTSLKFAFRQGSTRCCLYESTNVVFVRIGFDDPSVAGRIAERTTERIQTHSSRPIFFDLLTIESITHAGLGPPGD